MSALEPEDVISVVSEVFEIPQKAIKGRVRRRPVVWARKAAIELASRYTHKTPIMLAHFFNLDRASVYYSLKTIHAWLGHYPEYREKYTICEQRLEATLRR